ncbi:MAG: lamin tail domain-containing protein [Bacteroidetes bacterium]|nr:lamin tail domain-containing protein [Bacteroidota bacterium]
MKKIFLLFSFVAAGFLLNAQSQLIISEYVEGWSNNKALELFNPTNTAVNLKDFRLIRYSNGEDVPAPQDKWTIRLPDYSLDPFKTIVIVIDQRNPLGTGQDAPVWMQLQERANIFLCPEYEVSETMYFNGDDAIVIEKEVSAGVFKIHDIFGRWGAPAPADALFVGSEKRDGAWTNVSPFFTGEGVAITAEHTMVRKSNVSEGIKTNPTIFNPLAEYDTLSANTFNHLGWHKFDNAPANATPVFTNQNMKFFVSPTATNGTEIGNIGVTDSESDALKYYIDYGNFIYIADTRHEPFKLDKTTGKLSLVDAVGLAPELIDTFYLKIYVTDGFSQAGPATAMVVVTDSPNVGVNNNLEDVSLKVYPNPATNGRISISASKAFNSYELINVTGQVVQKESFGSFVNSKEISVTDISKGIYFMSVNFDKGYNKIVKLLIK